MDGNLAGEAPVDRHVRPAAETAPLVERLRTDVLWHRRRGNETIARDCQEAADEIERLRTVAENTVALLEHLTNNHLSASKHALCWRVLDQAREVLKA